MLRRVLISIVGIGLILSPIQVFAISSKAGDAGANFLKVGVSARASAMGEVFCAVADDVSSIYYNPAGLVQIKQRTFGLMHTDWLEEVNYEFLAYAEPYNNDKVFGMSLNYLGMGKMKIKDINNQTLGDFDARDLALSIAYAKKLKENLFAGANLKFIQQELEKEVSSSVAVDGGILYKKEDLSLGACISNLGTKIKFIKDKESLPLNLKLGIAYKLLDNRVILALDINRPIDNDINFGIGTEYQVTNNLFVRAGYNSRSDLGNGISLGCGFKVGNFQVDYCFLPYERLGDVHRFSLQFKLRELLKSKSELPLPPVEQETLNKLRTPESQNTEYVAKQSYLEEETIEPI
ncbi:MAG: PorV/PorQ family protein [bacterium]|nr:PorV/PorQ family protein [bacterium]